jgi:hypothetical protein
MPQHPINSIYLARQWPILMAPVRCPNRFLESVSKKPLCHKRIGLLPISTTSGTFLLHNQRFKPDNEKPDQCVSRPGRRALIVGQGEAGFYRPVTKAQRRSSNLADEFAKPIIEIRRCGSTSNAANPIPIGWCVDFAGALISVFLLDCLRYRRGNAGYHRRE